MTQAPPLTPEAKKQLALDIYRLVTELNTYISLAKQNRMMTQFELLHRECQRDGENPRLLVAVWDLMAKEGEK